MSYENHPAILNALNYVKNWIDVEGEVRTANISRELVKTYYDKISSKEATCRIAAFSLILGKLEMNAGNVAWVVRDLEIGYPERPTFGIV